MEEWQMHLETINMKADGKITSLMDMVQKYLSVNSNMKAILAKANGTETERSLF